MIESLDVKTLIFVLVLGHAVAAFLLFFDTRKRARSYDVLFMISMALQSVAWLLIFLRGSITDLLSFGTGNSLIFLGLCLEGICFLSLERPVDRTWRLVFATVLAVLLVSWWIPGLGQDTRMGIAAFIAPVFFVIPAYLMVLSAPRPSTLQKFIGATILLYVFATMARGVYILLAGSYNLVIPSFYQILFLLVQILAMILMSTGYILIRKEFANEDLEKDITRRTLAEEKLRQGEEKYRKLFEQSNDAIFIADVVTRQITDCNRKAEELMGYSRAEILGMRADDLHPRDVADSTMERFREFQGGMTSSIESEIITRDGRYVPVSINAGPVEIGGKNFLIGIFRDITWQKDVEKTIREKNEEVDQFFTTSLDLFCIADIQGYFRRLNPEWEKTLGYSLKDLEGKRFLDFVHPDDLEETMNAIVDLAAQKEVLNFVNRYRHKDGTYRWIEWRSFPKGERIFAAARDITTHYIEEHFMSGLGSLKQELLIAAPLEEKLRKITGACVSLFSADFARIWIAGPGDLCEKGCVHASITEGLNVCRNRSDCLHLIVSSGRYTHIDGNHRRVPFGVYKIGRIASGEDARVITNDVVHDTRIHDPGWAATLRLVSFAGFQLLSSEGKPIGVLAFFSRQQITPGIIKYIEDLATTTSQVILAATAEDARKETEEKYRTLVDYSQSIIYSILPDGTLTFVSPSWKWILGHEAGEVVNHNLRLFVHGDDIPVCEENLAKTVQTRTMQPGVEYRVFHKNGSVRWHRSVIVPVFNKDGSITSFIGNAVDFTDRKLAEEALRESEEKYRTIIDDMEDMFYRTDNEGNFTMISPSGARLVGYETPDQLIGMKITRHWENPGEREKFLDALRKGGSVTGYPVTICSRDGKIHYLRVSSHFYRDKNGTVQGIEGIIHDVTDLQRAENSLRLANKKLNLLSSITRHDIKNQLTVLMGYIALSKESLDDTAKISEYIIREERAANTIGHQISFTKEYQDLGVQAPHWQSVKACIRQAVDEIPLGGTEMIIDLENLELYADPLLEKVFYNLIDNALRYGGLQLSQIRITSSLTDSQLVLLVEDDGEGIPVPEKEKIFLHGYGKNTGMGLFLAREILAITGLSIHETGEAGKGARFEITVPDGMYRY